MNIQFTRHAADRISNRLNGLLTADEVCQAIEQAGYKPGRWTVNIKNLGHRIYLGDPSDPATPKGDMLTVQVICDCGTVKVITVMLVKSSNPRWNA